MKENKLYMWLAYSGALPFVFCAALMALGHRHVALAGELPTIINTYSLVIIVFMSGIYWGLYLNGQISQNIYLLIISNIITILSWLAFLLISMPIVLLFYSVMFLILLIIDYKLLEENVITQNYFKTRMTVTSIVIASLLTGFSAI